MWTGWTTVEAGTEDWEKEKETAVVGEAWWG